MHGSLKGPDPLVRQVVRRVPVALIISITESSGLLGVKRCAVISIVAMAPPFAVNW